MATPNIQDPIAIDQQTVLLEQAVLAGNLEQAKLALAAGAKTEGSGKYFGKSALELAIFYNPRNRLEEGVTREWCEWMRLDPVEYADKPYSRVVETPKPGEVSIDDYIETYPNLQMVELLMQHGASPDHCWGQDTTFIKVLNHSFLKAEKNKRYKEYQATLENIVDLLLPSVRRLNLNLLDWYYPRMHGTLLEKIWNHVLHHQIEQPGLCKPALQALLEANQNPNETIRQLISLNGLTGGHFQVFSEYTDFLPSVLTLEFAIEHIVDSKVDWPVVLSRFLTAACEKKYWLYAGDLIRLGAMPNLRKISSDNLKVLISIYPRECLNKSINGETLLHAICRGFDRNSREIFINKAFERGANLIPEIQDYRMVTERKSDFRYVLALAQVANLDPNKVPKAAETDPLHLFKQLPKEIQQYVIQVGFMAPRKYRAPSGEHAGRVFQNLKAKIPEIEKKIKVQRKGNLLIDPLRKRHLDLIDNSVPSQYRSRSKFRKKSGFYTLFHGHRAARLHRAIEYAESLDVYLLLIKHQLSFFPGEESVKGDPFPRWSKDAYVRLRLSQKFKRAPIKSQIGYYGMLKKMQQETEDAISQSYTSSS